MIEQEATRWCPHCQRPTVNAPLPQMAGDLEMIQPLEGPSGPRAFRRKLYCTDCRAIWDSLELPADVVHQLAAHQEALEDAKRQIAMLKLLSAKKQQDESAAPAAAKPLRLAG